MGPHHCYDRFAFLGIAAARYSLGTVPVEPQSVVHFDDQMCSVMREQIGWLPGSGRTFLVAILSEVGATSSSEKSKCFERSLRPVSHSYKIISGQLD